MAGRKKRPVTKCNLYFVPGRFAAFATLRGGRTYLKDAKLLVTWRTPKGGCERVFDYYPGAGGISSKLADKIVRTILESFRTDRIEAWLRDKTIDIEGVHQALSSLWEEHRTKFPKRVRPDLNVDTSAREINSAKEPEEPGDR